MKARFAKEIGTRVWLRIYWGESCTAGKKSCCNAMRHLKDELHPLRYKPNEEWHYEHVGGQPKDYQEEMWPTVCEDCGQPVPKGKFLANSYEEGIHYQVFNKRLYDTPSGNLEPGSLYWMYWFPQKLTWNDGNEQPSLGAVLPNGWEWNIDSRASNCGSPNDNTHRCWVRHGDPETGIVHVDKNGHTCNAGAGSIGAPGWHGFLHNGEFH